MADQLPRFSAGGTKPHAVDHIVEATFQQLQQVLTGCALEASSFLVIVPKLLLEDTVDTAYFLLLAQLHTVVGQTTATGAVLAGSRFGLALAFQLTDSALQEQICSFTTGELARGSNISSHVKYSCER